MARVRLDQLLTERGLARSRAEAQAHPCRRGRPRGQSATETGQLVADDASVSLVERPSWASRAGVKLEHALDAFGIDPTGMAALDAGVRPAGSPTSC